MQLGPPTSRRGAGSVSVPWHWIPVPYLDCLVEPHGRVVVLGLDVPGGGGTQTGLPFSEEKGGQWGEEFVKMDLGREEGDGL